MDRVAVVRDLVRAARALVVDRGALVRATGLSREGVDLALERHLELDPTDDDLRALVAGVVPARRVAVILSSNVFVGALRAIALARAASDEVIVRPSRREPVFARALVLAANDPRIRLDEDLDVASLDEGEIHVYGRDETIARIRGVARVRVRGHGSGMGIAIVSSPEQARALADDVVAFDQRGCLSPRVVLALGDAGAIADALHAELGRSIPRGEVPADERAAIRRYADTMAYAGRVLVGREHVIGVGSSFVLPPTYRTVHVVPVSTVEAAVAMVLPFTKGVVTVGADDLDVARVVAPRWARLARIGAMQRPPLDGPVDRRDA